MSTSCFCHRFLVASKAAGTVLNLCHYQGLVFEEDSMPIDPLELFEEKRRTIYHAMGLIEVDSRTCSIAPRIMLTLTLSVPGVILGSDGFFCDLFPQGYMAKARVSGWDVLCIANAA